VAKENPPKVGRDSASFPFPFSCISLVGLSSILNSLSLFLGGVTGRAVGTTGLVCPNMKSCLFETSAEALPPPLKLKAIGAAVLLEALVED
jgi:hypothetical protein